MSARYSGSNFDARVLRASICVDGSQGCPPCDPTIHANDECCWGTAHAKRLPLRLRSSPGPGSEPRAKAVVCCAQDGLRPPPKTERYAAISLANRVECQSVQIERTVFRTNRCDRQPTN